MMVAPDTDGTSASLLPLRGWRAALRDLAQMVRFYSRIPVPKLPFEADPHAMPDFRTAPRALAVAGLIIGLPGAAALGGFAMIGLSPLMAAALAVAVSVFAAGAFHEDGLADTFDGLPGGHTPERRLEIMKDSRIGSYGGSALMLSLLLRVTGLSAILDAAGPLGGAAAMVAAASLSRPIGLTPLALLPPARSDGFSAAVGRPTLAVYAIALGLGLSIASGIAIAAGLPSFGPMLGLAMGLAAALLLTSWARRAIGGQTGDIAGACQQLAEICFYVSIVLVVNWGKG